MKSNKFIVKLGKHRIVYGDATTQSNYKNLMENKRIDLLLTDPPYNVNYLGNKKSRRKIMNDNLLENYQDFVHKLLLNCFSYMKSGASYYVFVAGKEIGTYQDILGQLDVHQSLELVWVKNHFVLSFADYKARHEHILHGWKKGAAHKYYGVKNQSSVLEFPKPVRNKYHSTQKPRELIKHLMLNSSLEKEIVFDPCLGSGTTLLEAEEHNRICYGMELDYENVKTIINRFKFHYPNENIEYVEMENANDESEIK